MKNTIIYTFIILIGIITSTSCQKTNDLADLSDSFTLKRNGANMPVYVHGNAQDKIFILTLSGGPGDPGLALRSGGWNDDLEEKYAMVYWDQRGSGMSQGQLTADNFNFEELKLDVEAMVILLKHKYGDDITLFLLGQSWGSMLGSGFLADDDNQTLFKGWISTASGYAWCATIADLPAAHANIANEQIEQGHEVAFWETQLELVAEVDPLDCKDYRLNNGAAKATSMLEKSGTINQVQTTSAGAFNAMIVNNYLVGTLNKGAGNDFLFEQADFEYLDLSEQLADITLPTLVMHGKWDLNVALESAVKYYDLLGASDKTFVEFENSGHALNQYETDKYGATIIDFVEMHK